jgi:hypothetical protein
MVTSQRLQVVEGFGQERQRQGLAAVEPSG